MRLSIFNNQVRQETAAPFVMSVSLDGDVVPPDTHYHVPVYLDQTVGANSRKQAGYNVEVCGFRLESPDPEGLLKPAAQLLGGLINMARLPNYIFAAGRSMLIYPVYTVDDEVFATTPGGPVFRHVELAKVRGFLGDYLHTMQELGTPGAAETLHVRGVDPTTLGLMRPAFYLKKRVEGETEFWAPVFADPDGRTVCTYAASAPRRVAVSNGLEILDLHAVVAEALIADRRLASPLDLRPDRLFPAHWSKLEAHLARQPYTLEYAGCDKKQAEQMPLYRYGKFYLMADHRSDEDRYNLYLGSDPLDLRQRVAQDFMRRALKYSESELALKTA